MKVYDRQLQCQTNVFGYKSYYSNKNQVNCMEQNRQEKEQIQEETIQITDRIAQLRQARDEQARNFQIRQEEGFRNNRPVLDNITSLNRRYLRAFDDIQQINKTLGKLQRQTLNLNRVKTNKFEKKNQANQHPERIQRVREQPLVQEQQTTILNYFPVLTQSKEKEQSKDKMQEEKKDSQKNKPLTGELTREVIAFTGQFEPYSKDELIGLCQILGAKTPTTLAKATTVLLQGAYVINQSKQKTSQDVNQTSKSVQAKERGIRIVPNKDLDMFFVQKTGKCLEELFQKEAKKRVLQIEKQVPHQCTNNIVNKVSVEANLSDVNPIPNTHQVSQDPTSIPKIPQQPISLQVPQIPPQQPPNAHHIPQQPNDQNIIYRDYPESEKDHPRGYMMDVFGQVERYSTFRRFTTKYQLPIPPNCYYLYHYYAPIKPEQFIKYNWHNLWELNLIGCQIDDHKFQIIVKGAHAYPNVAALLLSENNIRTVTEKMLENFPRLRFVNFGLGINSNPYLTEDSLHELAQYQKKHPAPECKVIFRNNNNNN